MTVCACEAPAHVYIVYIVYRPGWRRKKAMTRMRYMILFKRPSMRSLSKYMTLCGIRSQLPHIKIHNTPAHRCWAVAKMPKCQMIYKLSISPFNSDHVASNEGKKSLHFSNSFDLVFACHSIFLFPHPPRWSLYICRPYHFVWIFIQNSKCNKNKMHQESIWSKFHLDFFSIGKKAIDFILEIQIGSLLDSSILAIYIVV